MSILFKEQWHRPDGSLLAIPHVTTKNDTFLRHCQVLKRMGIENYAFPLTLYNPELKNVNVHDLEEDTPENERLRTAVMIESRHNVWYYLRECVRIYSQGGKPVQFRLDRGSCAMVWSFLNGIDYAGMQPRQAQPLSAKIRTPDGVVTMADMHVGKKILAPDGRETFVIGVYPQGVKMVYRITLEGGMSTNCCLDHLWNVYNDNPNESFRTMSLGDIIESEETLSIPVWNHNEVQTLHRIVNIEHIGQEEVQCIEVDHPDHLYITDEDIVSHNTGKDQPLYSKIKTPAGWTTMGDIGVGDKVVTPDGTTSSVVGVFPQGEKDVYRVTFSDGRTADCGKEHLWKVYNRDWTKNDGWRILPLNELKRFLDTKKSGLVDTFVPLISPEIQPDTELPIDPYILGILIGGGNLSTGTTRFTTADDFILNEVTRLLPTNTEVVSAGGYDYRIVDRSRVNIQDKSPWLDALRSLELMGSYSYNKFIPIKYMDASPSQKAALLQGLMDSNGTVDKSSSISFSTTSIALAEQVTHLVRSLGGLCKIKHKQTYYEHNGEKLKGRLSFTLRIRMKDPKNVFRLPRKRDRVSDNYKSKDSLKLGIVSIHHIGKHQTQCISIDHPDHLYITDDFVVTHNTVCALALTSWVIYSSGEDYQIGHFAKDNALRQENVKRVKSFGEFLPKWWLSVNKFKDKNNSEEIYYDALRTHYITMVAQSDKRQADLKARGSSQPMLHIDELEFCVNIDISYPTMLASTGTARENARKNGKPYSNILTTTAGDPSKAECKAAANILSGAMPFSEFLYDLKNKEELHSVVKANSPQMMLLGVFSHLQLGYDNNWLRDMITRNNMTREQTMRDYLNRRVSIQETPVIPKETLALITASEMEHKHIEILNGKYVIYWYIDKEVVQSATFRHRPIVVGCDSSEMIGRDSTTLVGVDPRDLSVVFTFRANEGNLNIVGAVIAELLLAYPGMIFVPENKSTGVGFIDTVSLILQKHNHNPFKRMFNWIVNNYSDEEFSKYDIRDMSLLDTTAKKYFGIKTDKNKRDQLYSTTLITAAQRAPTRIRDKTLIAELSGLVVKNGRVDHETGSNDDMVVAWLLCMWFILNAKHLDMYGIKPGTIFSLAPSSKDKDEQIELLRQEKIQNRIDELMAARRRQADPSLRMLIDKDLDLLRTLQEKHGIPDTVVADDLHRNPKKYIDQDIANASKEKSDTDTVKNSIQAIFRSSR